MPLFLVPPPQRIHTTRRDFAPESPALASVDPRVAAEAEPALAALRELLPALQVVPEGDTEATIHLSPLGETDSPAILRIEVDEAEIRVAASSRAGWLRAATLLRQIGEGEAIVGVEIEDWATFATRECHLPLAAAALTEEYAVQLLIALAEFGFNQLSFLDDAGSAAAEVVVQAAERVGIRLIGRDVPPPDAAPLLEGGEIGFVRRETLEALPQAALGALATGRSDWCVTVGALDEATLLGGLWPGLYLGGACGWNPKKAEYRAVRRTCARRFFGSEAAGVETVFEAMEAVAEIDEGTLAPTSGERPLDGNFARLFAEDPFRPVLRNQAVRLLERARLANSEGLRALDALEEAREAAARNEIVLGTLEWPIRRLIVETEHVLLLERARESYADAFASDSAARAATQRLRTTAETLGAVANQVAALDRNLEFLFARERVGRPALEYRAQLAARIAALRAKAEELRAQRDRYIQSGSLPTPEAMGLGREEGRLGRVVLPGRLPPQHSPGWWPEGGFARIRMDVDAEHDGMPWEVLVSLRSLSGDEGTFALGGAHLVPFDPESGDVGATTPCQLTRGGLVFVTEAGRRHYYLYLDLRGEERRSTPAERAALTGRARSRSPRDGIVLENSRLSFKLNPLTGAIHSWRYRASPDADWIEASISTDGHGDALFALGDDTTATPTRARVIENGPLMVRAQVELDNGRVRQYDLHAGATWCEFATNPPVQEVFAHLAGDLTVTDGIAYRASGDGWSVALASPDDGVTHTTTASGQQVEGQPHLSRLVFGCVPVAEAKQFAATVAAMRRPPVVRFGVVEERRAREF